MNPNRSTTAIITVLGTVLTGTALAQDRTQAWNALRTALDTEPPAKHVTMLTAFVAEYGATDAGARADEVLAARLRLASIFLASLELARAEREFATVHRTAPPRAIDLYGTALYGLAQTAELGGDTRRAGALYATIVEELTGTRYADFARVALHRLDRPPAARPRVGGPAPEFGPALDRSGTAHRLADRLGRPALLLFVDPADDDALDRVARLVRSARAAGLTDDAMITLVSGGSDAVLAKLARRPEFRMPIVPNPGEFLATAFLRYEIRSLPSTFLIGPDGTILGRDLPARRLRDVLVALRR